jgi:hypothetical protein
VVPEVVAKKEMEKGGSSAGIREGVGWCCDALWSCVWLLVRKGKEREKDGRGGLHGRHGHSQLFPNFRKNLSGHIEMIQVNSRYTM